MKKINNKFHLQNKTVFIFGGIALFVIVLTVSLLLTSPHTNDDSALQTASAQSTTGTSTASPKSDSAMQFMTALTFKYLSIYPFLCEQSGYTMKNYQTAFITTFSPELKKYKNRLAQNNISEIKAWDRLPEDFVRAIFFTVDSEIQSLADAMSKQPAYKGINITAKEACAMLDKNASSLFEEKLKSQVKEKTIDL